MNNKDKGIYGENKAMEWLQKNKFDIIERNWRYKNWEIDIIALKDKKLHFIEVKTRTSILYGYPERQVGKKKMISLQRAATYYMDQHTSYTSICFDIIAVMLLSHSIEITLFEDVYF